MEIIYMSVEPMSDESADDRSLSYDIYQNLTGKRFQSVKVVAELLEL